MEITNNPNDELLVDFSLFDESRDQYHAVRHAIRHRLDLYNNDITNKTLSKMTNLYKTYGIGDKAMSLINEYLTRLGYDALPCKRNLLCKCKFDDNDLFNYCPVCGTKIIRKESTK